MTARILLVLAAAALAWSLFLALFGGVGVSILGHLVRSNEPLRPLAVAMLALAASARLYGVARAHELWWRVSRRLDDGPMAVGLAIFVLVIGIAYNSTTAGGSDSYGYVSQADLWRAGRLHLPQPWVHSVPWPTKAWSFTPLGYRPLDDAHPDELVPTYSAGYPLLMAAAASLAGRSAMFWVVPIAGAVLVFMTYGIGRRLGSPRAGLIGAFLVATSPVVLYMLMLPMTDVPAAAAWAAAVYFALGGSWRSAAAGGLATGIAILIRPNLAPLAAGVGWCCLMPGWRRGLAGVAAFSAGAAAGIAAAAAINWRVYGSPAVSGYGDVSMHFAWSNILPNLRIYGGWLLDVQTPIALVGLAALAIPLRRFWPGAPSRWVFAATGLFALTLLAEYAAYSQFEFWAYLRFLLPMWPLMMIGVGAVVVALGRSAPAGWSLAVSGLVLYLGAYEYRLADKRGAFDVWRDERASVLVARRLRDETPPNSVIFSFSHSGSVRYYAGRMTLRYDLLDTDWLDRGVDWLAAHGAHPYLLINDLELPQFRTRFAQQHAVSVVTRPAIFMYQGSGRTYLFDLLPAPPAKTRVISLTSRDTLRSASPAAPAPFLLQ